MSWFWGTSPADDFKASLVSVAKNAGLSPTIVCKSSEAKKVFKLLDSINDPERRGRVTRVAAILSEQDDVDVTTLLASAVYFLKRPPKATKSVHKEKDDPSSDKNMAWFKYVQKNFSEEISEIVKNTFQIREIPLLFVRANEEVVRDHAQAIRSMIRRKMSKKPAAIIRVARFIDEAQQSLLLDDVQKSQYVRMSIETVYKPLAATLQLDGLYEAMCDVHFQLTCPHQYAEIQKKAEHYERKILEEIGKKWIDDDRGRARIIRDHIESMVIKSIPKELFSQCRVSTRRKSYFSIFDKQVRKPEYAEWVFDFYAARNIPNVHRDSDGTPYQDGVTICANLLASAKKMWRDYYREEDNYLNTPKENGYQAGHQIYYFGKRRDDLHLCWEYQITEQDMYECSLNGTASHKGVYKQVEGGMSSDDAANDYMCNDDIIVYEGDGHIFRLPSGMATPIDLLALNLEDTHPDLNVYVTIKRSDPFANPLPVGNHLNVELITGDVVTFEPLDRQSPPTPLLSQGTPTAALG